MIKLYKKEQLEKLKEKYSKEILKEAKEIIVLLDDNYGANIKLSYKSMYFMSTIAYETSK